MPIPVIAAALAIAAAAALVYFFTSNRAAQNRTEYERKVQAVLDLLTEKVKRLKERVEKSEAENRELKRANEALRKKAEGYKAELKRAQAEKAMMEGELARWRNIPSSSWSRMALLGASPVLLTAKFSPSKAISNLEERQIELVKELRSLEAEQ